MRIEGKPLPERIKRIDLQLETALFVIGTVALLLLGAKIYEIENDSQYDNRSRDGNIVKYELFSQYFPFAVFMFLAYGICSILFIGVYPFKRQILPKECFWFYLFVVGFFFTIAFSLYFHEKSGAYPESIGFDYWSLQEGYDEMYRYYGRLFAGVLTLFIGLDCVNHLFVKDMIRCQQERRTP